MARARLAAALRRRRLRQRRHRLNCRSTRNCRLMWALQRGRTRPAALPNLRWFDPRAGMWLGCAMAYPQLIAAEYVGERMVSLDFGKRQFVVEGEQLGELIRRIQDGSVIAIQEYAPTVWPQRPAGPYIASIRRIGPAREGGEGR
jgi:hypothetical protein